MRNYDFAKAKELIEAEIPNGLTDAALGMHEDWFWTAETVWEAGEWKTDLTAKDLTIGGIEGSTWATPTLELRFSDGDARRMVPCFTGKSENTKRAREGKSFATMSRGVLSGPCQDAVPPLEAK